MNNTTNERFRFRSWDETQLIRERLVDYGNGVTMWVESGKVPLSSPVPWLLPDMPSCSICRSNHGAEITHPCE